MLLKEKIMYMYTAQNVQIMSSFSFYERDSLKLPLVNNRVLWVEFGLAKEILNVFLMVLTTENVEIKKLL